MNPASPSAPAPPLSTVSAALPAVLRYGGDASFAPYESLDAQGRPQGFQMAVLQALGRRLNWPVQLQLAPWPQTEAAFRQGQVELVAMVPTASRRSWARFARGHATPALTVYHRQGEPDPQGPEGLAGLRLAVLEGEAMQQTLDTLLQGLPAPSVQAGDALAALQAVQAGEADAAVLLRAYADPLLQAGRVPGVVASRLNLGLQTYAFAVLPHNTALLQALQAGLDALEADGTLESLRTRWLPSHAALAQAHQLQAGLGLQQRWTWGVAGASALALGSLGWVLQRRHRQARAERAGRLQAEAALQRAEELLERSFTQHPEAMLVIDRASACVRDANPAAHRLLGLPAGSLIDQPLAALQQHLPAEMLALLRNRLDQQGQISAAPVPLRQADGSRRETLLSADEMQVGAQTQVFCLLRDITDTLRRDAELRAGYETLLAELRRSEAELDQARQGRARAEERLEDFTQAVAFELKTPLRALHGLVGLLRARVQAGHVREALAYSAHIERAGQRMNSLVSALARLAQVRQQPLQRQPVDMATLAQAAWASLQLAHPQRRAQCRFSTLPAAHGDPVLLEQLWQQVLDNAAKFSERASPPQIGVDSHSDALGLWWRVTDNGVGFDMSRAAGLFQPFTRLPSAAGFEGVGIGLALARRIVELHGGQIKLRSAPGVGTVLEFTLPAAGAAVAGHPLA